MTLIVLSILSIAIILNAFKQGERWAWYTLWIWPVWMAWIFVSFLVADRQPDFAAPPPMLSAPVFFVVTSLVLVTTYRKFFPKP
jgi:hypothetical protein